MDNRQSNQNRGARLDPANVSLLGNPLDLIYKDHLREREICALIERIAAADIPECEDSTRVLSFLGRELPLHLADKEQDLLPLLRRRCGPEDGIEKVIEQFAIDHRNSDEDMPTLMATLAAIETRPEHFSDMQRTNLARYATQARHRLTLINAIILPFARLRLTETDLETLTLRMMQRRGLDRLAEREQSK